MIIGLRFFGVLYIHLQFITINHTNDILHDTLSAIHMSNAKYGLIIINGNKQNPRTVGYFLNWSVHDGVVQLFCKDFFAPGCDLNHAADSLQIGLEHNARSRSYFEATLSFCIEQQLYAIKVMRQTLWHFCLSLQEQLQQQCDPKLKNSIVTQSQYFEDSSFMRWILIDLTVVHAVPPQSA